MLDQVMDWCRQATIRYLIQCWHLMVTLGHNGLSTLRPKQNGRHFPDDIFKWIFLNENIWILLRISLKFVPRVRINNIPALVQIMAWHRPGDKPFSEPMMISLLTHICVTRPQWVKYIPPDGAELPETDGISRLVIAGAIRLNWEKKTDFYIWHTQHINVIGKHTLKLGNTSFVKRQCCCSLIYKRFLTENPANTQCPHNGAKKRRW